MSLRDRRRTLTPPSYFLAAVVLIVIIAAGAWVNTTLSARQRAKEAQAAGTVAKAGERASGAAVEAVAAQGERQAQRDETTRKNRDDILSAPGAEAPVDPGVGNAGLRALCMRDIKRDPRCPGLLGKGPAPAS